jgi:hypothetical protein
MMAVQRWSDEQILEALHLRENVGESMQAIADHLGRSRNSVIGLMDRVIKETAASDQGGNQNGTMPEKWWKR